MPIDTSDELWIPDETLLDFELRRYDPENSIPNLDRGIPDPTKPVRIIGWYDETPTGGIKAYETRPYIWCCHCQKPTHWNGWIIEDEQGRIFIIGKRTCGREHFGLAFESAELTFRKIRDRQRALRLWSVLEPKLQPALEDINAVLAHPWLGVHERKRIELKKASGQAFNLLQKIAKVRHPLKRYIHMRNHEAEAKRQRDYETALATFEAKPRAERRKLEAQGFKPELETEPLYIKDERNLGVMVGTSLLIEDGDLREYARGARKTVEAAIAVSRRGTTDATAKELNDIRSAVKTAIDDLLGELISVNFAELFFEPANRARLEEWSEGYEGFKIRSRDGSLVITDLNRGTSVIAPIGKSELPLFDNLEALRHHDLEEQITEELPEAA